MSRKPVVAWAIAGIIGIMVLYFGEQVRIDFDWVRIRRSMFKISEFRVVSEDGSAPNKSSDGDNSGGDRSKSQDGQGSQGPRLCGWYLTDGDEIVWPRGAPCCAKKKWKQQLRTRHEQFLRKNRTYELKGGSLLHTIVGGNWSQDNDLDLSNTLSPKTTVCMCLYSGVQALCSVHGFEDMVQYIGPTWWIPLPRTKNVANWDWPRNNKTLPGKWYAEYFDLNTNPYKKAMYHWAGWRDWVIEDLRVYDLNKNGHIEIEEFARVVSEKLDPRWLAKFAGTQPCKFMQGFANVRILFEFLPEVKRHHQQGMTGKHQMDKLVDQFEALFLKYFNASECTHLPDSVIQILGVL